jgi:hypothetical protein
VFNAESTAPFDPAERCPAYKVREEVAAAVRDKQRRDDILTAELISRGTLTVAVTTGIDGGMNPIFLQAVKSHGGPGATIRTASGTVPAYVNPPKEPAQASNASLGDDKAPGAVAPKPPGAPSISQSTSTGTTTALLGGAAPSGPVGSFDSRIDWWR